MAQKINRTLDSKLVQYGEKMEFKRIQNIFLDRVHL